MNASCSHCLSMRQIESLSEQDSKKEKGSRDVIEVKCESRTSSQVSDRGGNLNSQLAFAV